MRTHCSSIIVNLTLNMQSCEVVNKNMIRKHASLPRELYAQKPYVQVIDVKLCCNLLSPLFASFYFRAVFTVYRNILNVSAN